MLNKKNFAKNRTNFINLLTKNCIFILIENEPYSKRDSEFFNVYDTNIYYLTGIEQEETKLIIYKNSKGKSEEMLFLRKTNQILELWEGKKLSKKEAINISGIKNIYTLEKFENIFEKLCKKTKILSTVFDKRNLRKNNELEKIINFSKKKFKLKIENKFNNISKLRSIKSSEELEDMKKSAKITNIAFRKILRNLKNYKNEIDIEADLNYTYTKNFCSHSYQPIIASGINSCILHYIKNNQKLKKSNLVLIDSGAEYQNYKCDVTRTFPLSGKFSKRQKEVYETVLEIQKYALKELKIGISARNWEIKIMLKVLEKIRDLKLVKNLKIDLKNKNSIKNLKKYYPHSTGHFLGLDTHDYGDYKKPFTENQVLTVEPGIYIKEERIGIRIEDNVLLKKKKNIVLTHKIPKETKEIEMLIK